MSFLSRRKKRSRSTRTGEPVFPHCVEGASSSIAEPCARGRRSRSHRGGSQVGSRSVGPRRGKRVREALSLLKVLEDARSRSKIVPGATTEKEVCQQDIAESERRLEKLEAQVADTQIDALVDVSVGSLQERINVLQKERDALLAAAGDGPPSLDNIQEVEHFG